MKYASTYRTPDAHGSGYASADEYLLINSIGYYEFDPPYGFTYRQNGRLDYYLSYNHDGKMKVKLHQKDYEIGPGTIFLYAPHEEQYYEQIGGKPISNYWIHFSGYGVTELLLKAGLQCNSIYTIGVNQEIPVLMERIENEISQKLDKYEDVSAALFQELLFTMSRKVSAFNGNNKNPNNHGISKALDFIHKNYNSDITLSMLSDIAGFSISRFSAVFKKMTGVSPRHYITNYKIQKAKELFELTNLSIAQVIELVGFSDQFYFSRIFKKYEKINPKEYIKRARFMSPTAPVSTFFHINGLR